MPTFRNSAHDDRLDPGMATQTDRLAAALAAGATQIGWKAGLGSPTWRTTFGLDAPLVGFLLDTTRITSGAVVALDDWTAPRAEAELAVLMGGDVRADADPAAALAAVEALAPAIELVDISSPPEDPALVLGGNIYHRLWLTGTFEPVRPEMLGTMVGTVTATGADPSSVSDVQAATGAVGEVLAEIARIAARHGRGLQRGDIAILGSIIPPAPLVRGGLFRNDLSGHAPVEVRFAD